MSAKNLMNAVILTVKASYVASTKVSVCNNIDNEFTRINVFNLT